MKTGNCWIKWGVLALVAGAVLPVCGTTIDVQFQNSPMKIAFLGDGTVLAEVKEISVGTHVYNTIQDVQQNGSTYDVTFPDAKVMTISAVIMTAL